MQDTLLNLIPGACSPEVHLSQYDKGRAIPFKLANGKSAYTVPEGAEIVVMATKPSGLGFVVPVTFNGDTATMTITETMSNEYGRFPAELSITSNGNRIGTANFVMNIERSPHPEGTIDGDAESLLPELTLLVERIEAAADSVDEDTRTVTEAKAEVLQAKADTLQAKADTLTARDDALQAKADAITAKESAEASAQAAAEASERAEELIGSVATKADAIVKTASGEIASFSDGGDDLPMKSLKVNIVPKQSGSGDPSPSNARPISGWDSVDVEVAGKNLIFQIKNALISTSGNNAYYYANANCISVMFKCKQGEEYSVSGLVNNRFVYAFYDDVPTEGDLTSSFTVEPTGNTLPRTFTALKDGICVVYLSNALVDTSTAQIELGSTATTYEPYEGESKSISLGQTVYGGVLDVVSGKMTIDKIKRPVKATDSIGLIEDDGDLYRVGIYMSDIKPPVDTNDRINFICNIGKSDQKAIGGTPKFEGACALYPTTDSACFLYLVKKSNLSVVDGAHARQWLVDNGCEIVRLAKTPTEIQLTPTEVKTLLGANNIWADAGTVEVEYRADTTLAYNELLAMILENIGN